MNPKLILALIQQDYGLSHDDRQFLMKYFTQTDKFQTLLSGASGAAMSNVLSRYMQLSKPAQVLLSIAGFGIGSYFIKATRDSKNFVSYNDKMKAYELNYGRN